MPGYALCPQKDGLESATKAIAGQGDMILAFTGRLFELLLSLTISSRMLMRYQKQGDVCYWAGSGLAAIGKRDAESRRSVSGPEAGIKCWSD